MPPSTSIVRLAAASTASEIRNVHREGRGALPDPLLRIRSRLGAHVPDRDPRALGSKPRAHGKTDAGRSAGHDSPTALKSPLVCHQACSSGGVD